MPFIGPVTRYDVRIKVKVPTASKRSATPSRDETEYERRERKRNWRKYGNIKLHRIGSRCQFSLVPLEFVINQANRDDSFKSQLATCKIEDLRDDDESDYTPYDDYSSDTHYDSEPSNYDYDNPSSNSNGDPSSDYYNNYKDQR